MKKIFRGSFYFLAIYIVFIGCVSTSKKQNVEQKVDKFDQVGLGDEGKMVHDLFGPGETSLETYPNFQYTVLSYSKPSGEPDIFFTIDSKSNRVIGKSKWIGQDDRYYKLETFLNLEFKGINFKSYNPCRTRSNNDKILVNPDFGFYVATENNHVVLLSYVTKDLLNLRVDLIQKGCPNLQ
ncbi:MAG: hypothetical protein B7Y39_13165 [Bdellovibrio sp. 28-41-41]|nr:MAG: hypothetical protein B7Y39_13165 [Bdellovibrio sp. 28-41-41]